MNKSTESIKSIDDDGWYDWSKKVKSHFAERYALAQTPEQKETAITDVRDALWGLDVSDETDMKKVNSKPDLSAIYYLCAIGKSTRALKSIQQKIRPFLIVGALLSAGIAWHNHTNNLKTNPAMGIAAGLITVAALSKIWQDTLPPYPDKPTFFPPPKNEPQDLEQTQLQLHKTLMKIRKQQLDQIRMRMNNKELDTDELLVVELSHYEQKKKELDRATSVVEKLSQEEALRLTPYLKQPQNLLSACLDLAQQKENQRKNIHSTKHFKRQRKGR